MSNKLLIEVDFDTDFRDFLGQEEITCPYCKYELSNSWEYADSDILECHECGKMFSYERNTEVRYATKKLEEDEND
jgi:DNA-directed RNA polymerase subunit RPC12/RpoP